MSAPRINARHFMWASDYVKAMFTSLEQGTTVTKLSMGDPGEAGSIEFEIVVTKVGNKRLPRVASPLAKADSKPPKESST